MKIKNLSPERKKWLIFDGVLISLSILTLILSCDLTPVNKTVKKTAETALRSTVENPKSIKILAVSTPIEVTGNKYISDSEIDKVNALMTKVSDYVVSRTSDIENIDFSDAVINDLMQRQMTSMSTLRGLIPLGNNDSQDESIKRWKIKVEYTSTSTSGVKRHGEYWFFTDATGKIVTNSFEIPILDK